MTLDTKTSGELLRYVGKLEEENKLLKNEIAWLKDHTKYNGINEEYYIDGTMTATEAKLRLQQAEDNKNYVSKLEEENQTLKDNVEFLHSCLDDRDKSIELMKEEKKFKVLKEGLGIDLHSLDETLWQQNLLITRLEEENKKLKEKLEKWEKDYKEGIIVHCRNG